MSVKSIVNKKNITGITISFLFSYAITIGYLCENNLYSAVSAGNVIVFLSVWLISCILFILSWKALGEYGKKKGGEKENSKGFFIIPISFVVILLGYIPYFLIMFPGLFTYDASPEFVQIWYDEVPVIENVRPCLQVRVLKIHIGDIALLVYAQAVHIKVVYLRGILHPVVVQVPEGDIVRLCVFIDVGGISVAGP